MSYRFISQSNYNYSFNGGYNPNIQTSEYKILYRENLMTDAIPKKIINQENSFANEYKHFQFLWINLPLHQHHSGVDKVFTEKELFERVKGFNKRSHDQFLKTNKISLKMNKEPAQLFFERTNSQNDIHDYDMCSYSKENLFPAFGITKIDKSLQKIIYDNDNNMSLILSEEERSNMKKSLNRTSLLKKFGNFISARSFIQNPNQLRKIFNIDGGYSDSNKSANPIYKLRDLESKHFKSFLTSMIERKGCSEEMIRAIIQRRVSGEEVEWSKEFTNEFLKQTLIEENKNKIRKQITEICYHIIYKEWTQINDEQVNLMKNKVELKGDKKVDYSNFISNCFEDIKQMYNNKIKDFELTTSNLINIGTFVGLLFQSKYFRDKMDSLLSPQSPEGINVMLKLVIDNYLKRQLSPEYLPYQKIICNLGEKDLEFICELTKDVIIDTWVKSEVRLTSTFAVFHGVLEDYKRFAQKETNKYSL